MLAHSTTSSLLTPLLFLVVIRGLTPPASADHSVNSDRHDAQEWTVEESPEKAKLQQMPVAVRKMMEQEAEMFFQEYWQVEQNDRHFNPDHEPSSSGSAAHEPDHWTNSSTLLPFFAPIALHHDTDASAFPLRWARGLLPQLHSRTFQCPANTNACTSIDRPNSCCPTGDSCQLVMNTGRGEVACCGNGQTCAGNVQECATGYQSCPGNEGGGCCLPGYACVGKIGCAHSSTTTLVVNPQVTASPPTSSQPPSSSATTTSSAALAPLPFGPSSITSTSQSTMITSTTTSTTTSTPPPPTTSASSSSSSSSSSSLSTSSSSTSSGLFAPVRPTSASVVTTQYLSAAPSCPTGFYQCSAYYHGGCCRVGRDCGLTDCPASASSTVAQGNGVTIVAPSQAAAATAEGCASGWTTCGEDVGGGCCPPGGFECGRESCTKGLGAKVTGTGVTVGKSAGISSEGARMSQWVLEGRFRVGSLILGMGLGMLLLA
ncbi:MAG: hypothetical protein L6R37_001452 [Teloschistes peruensis]|nr:MAG: hypothetical protein L6R37_001452 [Teloschistes peruensis]